MTMTAVALHPQSSGDPRMLRWVTSSQLPAALPALDQLVEQGVLDRGEIGPGEIRTWLADGRSWADAGPVVRTALFTALRDLPPTAELAPAELRRRVVELIERDVEPYAASHGGGITVESIDDGVLTVSMSGACKGCALGHKTLDDLVRETVTAHFPQITTVRATNPKRSWLSLGMPSRRGSGR
ncbi:hypothetical protein MBRU_08205 [Mycolicibacterium brumae DSM 44177]|nr:hypothetical protein MBRU_08205 [Mycolicibacterium brumae DSM 44177]